MMVNFRESTVDAPAAHALLSEYFASRAETFPAAMGIYKTTLPDPARFVHGNGIFLVVEDVDLAGEPADVGCGGIRRLPSAAERGVTEPDNTEPDNTGPKTAEPVTVFEVKHLWLKPYLRGRGFGRLLLAELEQRARALGATRLVLDTNASLEAAAGLYRASGYLEIEPYNDNPNATHWFGKTL
jgi:ribosomal protein S18 acetylase RimI-like enzyme